MKPIIFLFCLALFIQCTDPAGNEVNIHQKENGDFELLKNGQPYFVKGARTLGVKYIDRVATRGGNSVRVGSQHLAQVLDSAETLGLTVLVGLPVAAERSGFNYSDPQAVSKQHEEVKRYVSKYRNHPAVLMWVIGNELDHVPGQETYNLKMWDAINDIAIMIHQEDPNHPAMTVIGTGRKPKLQDLIKRCPDLDLLGVNAYADLYEVPDWLREYNWNKPYLVTEWGPDGHWQVPKTQWGAVIEQTSTEKAAAYRNRYQKVISDDPLCLGSYVFLWASDRQERTHTWYNMFHDDGTAKQQVEVMYEMWNGHLPDNLTPRIDSIRINSLAAIEDINLEPGSENTAEVFATDPDGDPLEITWELLPELKEFGAYAGQGEQKPAAMPEFLLQNSGEQIQFKAPTESWNYRLFVYVHDGNNHAGVANIPFHVKVENLP